MDKNQLIKNLNLDKKPSVVIFIATRYGVDNFGKPGVANTEDLAIHSGDFLKTGRAAKMLEMKYNYKHTKGIPASELTGGELIEDLKNDGFKDVIEVHYICDEVKAAFGIKEASKPAKATKPTKDLDSVPMPTIENTTENE